MKKKIFIFDLDGVLINSKINMRYAWNYSRKQNNLNVSFSEYFENIGTPFEIFLNKIKIKKNQKSIEKSFRLGSIKNFHKIKLYPEVKKNLIKIKKMDFKIGILTSKDKNRTIKILNKFRIKNLFYFIECPTKNLRGKPHPDQIIKIIKKYSVHPKSVTYVGDMISDFTTANRAKVNFIFADYGYGKVKKCRKIKKFSDILQYCND